MTTTQFREAAALDHFRNDPDEGTQTRLDLLMIQLLVDKVGFLEAILRVH